MNFVPFDLNEALHGAPLVLQRRRGYLRDNVYVTVGDISPLVYIEYKVGMERENCRKVQKSFPQLFKLMNGIASRLPRCLADCQLVTFLCKYLS